MTSKLLSIVTVTRNNAKGLLRTSLSVRLLKKNQPNIEWIVIDGASSDESLSVIADNADIIDNWLSEHDAGIYNAMNKGIVLSSGLYLLFLNAGDSLSNEIVITDFDTLLSEKCDLYYGDAYLEFNNLKQYPDKLSIDYFFQDSLCHQSMLIKSDYLKERGYEEKYKIASDLEYTMYMLFDKKCSSHHIDIPICIYESGGFSSTHYFDIARLERREIISNHLDGGVDWYDSILFRKELSDENLFNVFLRLTYKRKIQSLTFSLIKALLWIHHLVTK